jgi:hypothetical protein
MDEVTRERVVSKAVERAKPLRVLENTLLDEMSYGIEIDRSGVAAEPERLERDGTTTCEAIEHLRGAIRVGLGNQLAQRIDVRRVGRRFERRGLGDEIEDVSATIVIPWIWEQRTEDHGAAHRQRPAGPPQVHGGDVAMSQRFLSR